MVLPAGRKPSLGGLHVGALRANDLLRPFANHILLAVYNLGSRYNVHTMRAMRGPNVGTGLFPSNLDGSGSRA